MTPLDPTPDPEPEALARERIAAAKAQAEAITRVADEAAALRAEVEAEWDTPESRAEFEREHARRHKKKSTNGFGGRHDPKSPASDQAVSNAAHDLGLTEDGVAQSFAARYRDRLRYCHHTGAWFQWDGNVWRQEETHLAFCWARQLARECRELAKSTDKGASKAAFAAAIERFAQSDRAFAVTSETWDRDPFLLGTPAGTVDLRTGRLRSAIQTDFITKSAAVAPAETPECPLWLKFLDEATRGDTGMIRFLRQWCGYCLTGDIREHALVFAYGPGGNGKGVFLNTVVGIMGDYANAAPMDTFTVATSDRHPTDLAGLRGARMVCASETEEGRAWAESRVKQITGGDTISARFMRRDFFEYKPQFKLTIIGNHKPILKNVDDAAKRRFNLAPFVHKPPVVDKQLEEKLKAEWPSILRWIIDGCLDWQANSLTRPQSVTAATAKYFADQDTIHQWIQDACEVFPDAKDISARLYGSWRNFATTNGEDPGSQKRFGMVMERLGFEPTRSAKFRGYQGLRVRFEPGYAD